MGMIGTNSANNNITITDDRAFLLQKAEFLYIPTEAEEVYEVGIYSNTSNVGKTAWVTVRNATDGVTSAPILGSVEVSGGAGGAFDTVTLSTPIQLAADGTYAVSVWIETGDWSGRKKGVWASNNCAKLSGQPSIPTDYSASTDVSDDYSFYALTRASTSPPEEAAPFDASITLSEECTSADFTLGMTAVKNRLTTPEYATALTALTQVKSRPAGDQATNTAVLYRVTFAVALIGGDTFDFVYDADVGDIAATATSNQALPSGTRSATVCS